MRKERTDEMHSNVDNPGTMVPAFLAKLWRLVQDPSTNDLICWNTDGKSFIIQNPATFARELLPLNYKHNNMASFIRQLNMYGFHKITSLDNGALKFDRDEIEFSHPNFQRELPFLLESIKRKIANRLDRPAASQSNSNQSNLPTVDRNGPGGGATIRTEAINKVLSDVKVIRVRQDSLDSRFSALRQENEALWREIAILRQKHMKQQQIINKLIQFLVTIVQPQKGTGYSNVGAFKRRFQLMINDAPDVKVRKSSETYSSGGGTRTRSTGSTTSNRSGGPVIHEVGEELLDGVNYESIDTPISPTNITSPSPNQTPNRYQTDTGDVSFKFERADSDSLDGFDDDDEDDELIKLENDGVVGETMEEEELPTYNIDNDHLLDDAEQMVCENQLNDAMDYTIKGDDGVTYIVNHIIKNEEDRLNDLPQRKRKRTQQQTVGTVPEIIIKPMNSTDRKNNLALLKFDQTVQPKPEPAQPVGNEPKINIISSIPMVTQQKPVTIQPAKLIPGSYRVINGNLKNPVIINVQGNDGKKIILKQEPQQVIKRPNATATYVVNGLQQTVPVTVGQQVNSNYTKKSDFYSDDIPNELFNNEQEPKPFEILPDPQQQQSTNVGVQSIQPVKPYVPTSGNIIRTYGKKMPQSPSVPTASPSVPTGGKIIRTIGKRMPQATTPPQPVQQIIPSTSSGISPRPDSSKFMAVTKFNNSNSSPTSGPNGTNKFYTNDDILRLNSPEEFNQHLENVQGDLDSLKELLRNDDYSLDNNSLLGNSSGSNASNNRSRLLLSPSVDSELFSKLFGDMDILPPYGLSLNSDLPTETKGENSGSEVMNYNPSLYNTIDFSDFLNTSSPELLNETDGEPNDHLNLSTVSPDAGNNSIIDNTDLNTPFTEKPEQLFTPKPKIG